MARHWIIGIDEVGRGPLAGPVTVAAVALPRRVSSIKYKVPSIQKKKKGVIRLRDSKKLSPEQRETWFQWVKEKKIPYAIASVSPRVIDKINITQAANLAATRAFKKLITKHKISISGTRVFLDGGLYVNKFPKLLTTNYKLQTIIKGDEKIPAISLASIVAKVTRDKRMARLHKKYPRYNFHIHKGYGTRAHIAALVKYGPSDIHRLTFIRKFGTM
ncbi:MAG: ribonuclease HII [Candidatus Jorgensenbacteria bacterium]|nr:ribonuclease HII [Candidatus Jorgensenbacteria bacterium]